MVDDEAQESMLKRLKTFLPPEQMSEVLELFGGAAHSPAAQPVVCRTCRSQWVCA